MTECLRLSRPCIFDGLALNSTAVQKWGFGTKLNLLDVFPIIGGKEPTKKKDSEKVEPYKYLLDKIGYKEVKVYKDVEPEVGFGNTAYNSYKEATAE